MFNKFKFSRLLFILLLTPIFINFLYNIVSNKFTLSHISIFNLIYGFFGFVIFYFIGKIINKTFQNLSTSTAIVIYILSFFSINMVTLNTKILTFNFYFYLVNILWVVVILKNNKSLNIKHDVLFLLLFLISNNILRNQNFIVERLSLSKYSKTFTWDVDWYWNPSTEMLYEQGLFYSLSENIIPGYGQLIQYSHSLIYKFLFNFDEYSFFESSSYFYLFLFILFVSELKISFDSKILIILLYFSVIINSDWLSYLFFNSTMGEGFVSIFFIISFYYIYETKFQNKFEIGYLNLFFISFLFHSKLFLSLIFLILVILKSMQYKNFRVLLVGFSGLIVNELLYKTYFSNFPSSNYIDFENFTWLEVGNVETLYNLFKKFYSNDKISTYLIFLSFLFSLLIKIKKTKMNRLINSQNLIIYLNLSLVLVLYLTIWNDFEVGSAYRYIITTLPIFILNFGYFHEELKF